MSLEQIEQSVLKLSEKDRQRFVRWMDDHRHEILPDEGEMSEDVRREILRRSDELRENPGLAQPVDADYFERMKRRVADALARKASTL